MKLSRIFGLAMAVLMLLSLGMAPALAQECAGEVIELEFMNWWGAAREAYMDELIGHFQEENPCIRVINQVQPWDNRAELLATAAASSNPPGIIMSTRPETYQFAINGLIIPIDSFVDAHGTDLSVFYDGEIGLQYWNGELYGLPMPTAGGLTGLMIYNKNLLRDAGFDPEDPPDTWQELEEMAAAITVADPMGIDVLGAAAGSTSVAAGGDAEFVAWLYTNNGQYASDDGRTLLFNSPEGVETLEWMINLTNNVNHGIENVTDFFQDTRFLPRRSSLVSMTNRPSCTSTPPSSVTSTWQIRMLMRIPTAGARCCGHTMATMPMLILLAPPATTTAAPGHTRSQPCIRRRCRRRPLSSPSSSAFMSWVAAPSCSGRAVPSPVKACNENPAYYDVNPYWSVVLEGLSLDTPVQITPVQGQLAEILSNNIEEAYYGVKSAGGCAERCSRRDAGAIG